MKSETRIDWPLSALAEHAPTVCLRTLRNVPETCRKPSRVLSTATARYLRLLQSFQRTVLNAHATCRLLCRCTSCAHEGGTASLFVDCRLTVQQFGQQTDGGSFGRWEGVHPGVDDVDR